MAKTKATPSLGPYIPRDCRLCSRSALSRELAAAYAPVLDDSRQTNGEWDLLSAFRIDEFLISFYFQHACLCCKHNSAEAYRASQFLSSTMARIGRLEQEMQDRLASVEEASQRLGVSTFTTRRLIKAGQLRAVRISKRVMIPETEIARVISQGCGERAESRSANRNVEK